MRYKAFIFDLNGTIIDDMAFHSEAWFRILNEELNAGLSREEVDRQMYGKNGEVLDRIFGSGKFSGEEKEALSIRKEQIYQEAYLPHLQLIPGLERFLERAAARRIPMAIGTAAIPFNVDFVVDRLHIRHFFQAIITASDVSRSKPDPETFLTCARALGVTPSDCLVFEDVPKGAEAAQNAGMDTVIITTGHQPEAFHALQQILFYIPDFTGKALDLLF
ncbi:HAD family hydrolase [Niabella drilacis]|uniref:Haloacid dehalogenase superfamily, subfamily IA, variant 3 with third motif having DD or ED n=1 Tax=Niabella drilacis (strain DSM 25811 / CCM 8410 / CCUG 62505 / LMG 26954 / E90) TaxID=1285928 RepID=A0A1G6V0S0_NIADE|nr:HAD family phosphatase [Niabella drilacis]SDD46577.1 haloacid dehalogenase superfamily, subfamily IA, variant 3 with third motif having DD or ED [Niabella drilacis]